MYPFDQQPDELECPCIN